METHDERHNAREDRHGDPKSFQCELSIVTATKLEGFIAQYEEDRKECAIRYANDRADAHEFRKEILEKIDALSEMLVGVVPSVETGRKIVWSVAALAAASIISGFFLGLWKVIKLITKFL